MIFEFGLAESEGFNYIDEEEAKKALNFLLKSMCSRWIFSAPYATTKATAKRRHALKFDYYMLTNHLCNKDTFEIQVFHERGPRYLSPEDLTAFVFTKVNEASETRKILRETKHLESATYFKS